MDRSADRIAEPGRFMKRLIAMAAIYASLLAAVPVGAQTDVTAAQLQRAKEELLRLQDRKEEVGKRVITALMGPQTSLHLKEFVIFWHDLFGSLKIV